MGDGSSNWGPEANPH